MNIVIPACCIVLCIYTKIWSDIRHWINSYWDHPPNSQAIRSSSRVTVWGPVALRFSRSCCAASSRNCVASDLVPRLSLHSVVGLRNDVIEMIARVKVPKHTILGRGQKNDSKNTLDLVHRQDSIPPSPYYDRVLEFQKHQTQLQNERNVPDVKLCLPGLIVHLIENRLEYRWRRGSVYIPIWAEREDFNEIQLTKNFLVDHDPERYLRILTNAAAVPK
jgi:hypothetical protein